MACTLADLLDNCLIDAAEEKAFERLHGVHVMVQLTETQTRQHQPCARWFFTFFLFYQLTFNVLFLPANNMLCKLVKFDKLNYINLIKYVFK